MNRKNKAGSSIADCRKSISYGLPEVARDSLHKTWSILLCHKSTPRIYFLFSATISFTFAPVQPGVVRRQHTEQHSQDMYIAQGKVWDDRQFERNTVKILGIRPETGWWNQRAKDVILQSRTWRTDFAIESESRRIISRICYIQLNSDYSHTTPFLKYFLKRGHQIYDSEQPLIVHKRR